MKKVCILLFAILAMAGSASPILAQAIDPQYIFVRKDPMNCNPADCSQLWNLQNPNLDLYPGIVDVYNKIGTHGNTAGTRKIGIGVQLNYYLGDFDLLKQSLNSLLNNSQAHTFPVYLSLNGFQWWDPNTPGFTPGDKNNVEWTCASPSCAISTSWRNWGSEFVVSPHPNIASRTFIDNNQQKLAELLPIIRDWYNALPADKKWLFGGIDLGTEVDIGGNYYYPSGGIGNSQQLGYAAVNTLGLSGGVTTANLNTVIRNYLNELDKSAFDGGIPRNKIFNHVGGSDLFPKQNNLVRQTAEAAISTYGNPGWSFYHDITQNPQNYAGLSTALNQVGNNTWASPEWLPSASDYNGWVGSLRSSLNYRNNKFINVANWEGIRDKQYAIDAIRTVVNEEPTCWVTTPYMQNVAISDSTVTLSWQKGTNNDAVYLSVSTVGEFTEAGILRTVDTVNDNVTSKITYTINNLGSGKYYWILAADGCSGTQRKIVYGSFQSATATPIAGDFTDTDDTEGDQVNLADYLVFKAGFGTTYTIFDYNSLVANFGQ